MENSIMYDRWQRNGLAAIPEDMDALQSQMRGADMNIAMLLTWNYMATKFNEQLDAIERYYPWIDKHEMEDANANG